MHLVGPVPGVDVRPWDGEKASAVERQIRVGVGDQEARVLAFAHEPELVRARDAGSDTNLSELVLTVRVHGTLAHVWVGRALCSRRWQAR